jgi:DNA-binding CsgD family transcriptional regulator
VNPFKTSTKGAATQGINPAVLVILIFVQALCAAFFLWDDMADLVAMQTTRFDLHQVVEYTVTLSLIKGCEIPEIARLRGCAEGTVKAHLNAIYRKADVSGRAALVSLLIEDLMGQPLIAATPGDRTGTLA